MKRRVPVLPAVLLILAVVAGALAPLSDAARSSAHRAQDFPGWPTQIDGRRVTELPLTAREARFAKDFPGRIGRFTDGRSELIVRFVASATRKLHPAADCFRGAGYRVEPMRPRKASDGAMMGCLRAIRGADVLIVCESIRDGMGQVWPDVSAWYWDALWGARGPWWSYVVATPQTELERDDDGD
jgi:hypothetical protein